MNSEQEPENRPCRSGTGSLPKPSSYYEVVGRVHGSVRGSMLTPRYAPTAKTSRHVVGRFIGKAMRSGAQPEEGLARRAIRQCAPGLHCPSRGCQISTKVIGERALHAITRLALSFRRPCFGFSTPGQSRPCRSATPMWFLGLDGCRHVLPIDPKPGSLRTGARSEAPERTASQPPNCN